MISLLTPILLFLTPSDTTFVNVDVSNYSSINKIGGRDVTFGVKEEIEEILTNKGYFVTDSTGFDVQVSIDSIYSPQQILNIIGIQWLRKDYIVETSVCIGSKCFRGKGERRTFVFAMFLNIENGEVPLNKKAFSKALQESLIKTTKQF